MNNNLNITIIFGIVPLLILFFGYVSLMISKNFPLIYYLRPEKLQALIHGMRFSLYLSAIISLFLLSIYLMAAKLGNIFSFLGYLLAFSMFIIRNIEITGNGWKLNTKRIIYPHKYTASIILAFFSALCIVLNIINMVTFTYIEIAQMVFNLFTIGVLAFTTGKLWFPYKPPNIILQIDDGDNISGYFLGYSEHGDLIILHQDDSDKTKTVKLINRSKFKILHTHPITICNYSQF